MEKEELVRNVFALLPRREHEDLEVLENCFAAFLATNEDAVSYGGQDPPPPYSRPDVVTAAGARPGAEPSAPPLELVDTGAAAGSSQAGNTNFPALLLPPKSEMFQAEESILYISEDEARAAFIQYAASKCCYRTAPAKHMMVQNLTALNTYRYRLHTFTESRSTLPASEPYHGGLVDGPAAAAPPAPWEVAVDPPPPFAACETCLPVPHTYAVQGCPNCSSSGLTPCSSCRGSGKRTCVFCGGSGKHATDSEFFSDCPHCNGSGRMRCFSCWGQGRVPCARCDAKGLLLCHAELTVAWETSTAEYVAEENHGFPTSRFQEVTGKELLSEENHSVSPLNLPAPLVRGAESCLALHQMQVSAETRILRQKHAVELIPLTKIDYDWKGKAYSFYVFGNEKKVYAEDYPEPCCCSLL
ncbi:protein SSUH2 homolog isoform X3 [Struthio camelus]|uniref:protein SSUH2 homolog isoform X3 n=1 Tax=Struthio camelus TaxID=8801 RepID=UPI0036042A5C